MSVCISQHGEYSSHEPDADYVCKLCGVLDEDALIAELQALRAANTELRDGVRALGSAFEDGGRWGIEDVTEALVMLVAE